MLHMKEVLILIILEVLYEVELGVIGWENNPS